MRLSTDEISKASEEEWREGEPICEKLPCLHKGIDLIEGEVLCRCHIQKTAYLQALSDAKKEIDNLETPFLPQFERLEYLAYQRAIKESLESISRLERQAQENGKEE